MLLPNMAIQMAADLKHTQCMLHCRSTQHVASWPCAAVYL